MKCGLLSSSPLAGDPGIDIRGTGTVMLSADNASPRFGRDGIVFGWVLMAIVVLNPAYKC